MIRTLAFLLFAELADLATTIFASTRGAHEGNPMFLMAAGSGLVASFVFAKLAVVPTVGFLIGSCPDPRKRAVVESIARFGATMLLGVAASNVLVAL